MMEMKKNRVEGHHRHRMDSKLFSLPLTIFVIAFSLMTMSSTLFVDAYLPGVSQETYAMGDTVNVKTRKLFSSSNLPFHFNALPFCRPEPLVHNFENFGEYLFGDRTTSSVYRFKFGQEITCQRITPCDSEDTQKCPHGKIVCPKITEKDIANYKSKIQDEYVAQMIVDNLPIANAQDSSIRCGHLPPAERTPESKEGTKYARPDGFPIGCRLIVKDEPKSKRYSVINHLSFTIKYNTKPDGKNVIVGAEVIPSSLKHNEKTCKSDSQIDPNIPRLELTDKLESIPFSYSVHWVKSNIPWGSRWDAYLNTGAGEDLQIHWFSIINSVMIALFLSAMVAMIMSRVLSRDIDTYNSQSPEDPTEETGWKLVHGDVFRTPRFSPLLSIFIGSGVQIAAIVVISLVFAVLGFVSPANRGGLVTVMLVLFVITSALSGYYSLRMYKMFQGVYWKTVSVCTALLLPGAIAIVFGVLNTVTWIVQSTTAIPFFTLLMVFIAWFGISVPMVFIGSYFGWKKQAIEYPVAVHQIPRQIPHQPFYMRSLVAVLLGGILPFGAVFIELYFIMSSIWMHRLYYIFPFLFMVFLILLLTCAEITIVMTYFQLCNEDYRWWWRSLLTAGSSAFYMFIYGVVYYVYYLQVGNLAMSMVYFGYTFLLCYLFFMLTGATGFLATFIFLRKIFSSIKVD